MNFVYLLIAIIFIILIVSYSGKSSFSSELPEKVTDEEIRKIALEGRKIEAIKYYRQLHGVGLKEAKDMVDKMI